MSTPPSAPVFSDDGVWWWDGQTWQPALSPDGRMRWDGRQWEPVPGQPIAGQPVPQPSADDTTVGRTIPKVPARLIKVGGAAAAIVALVVMGSLVLTHVLSPAVVSGAGYTVQVPQGWRLYTPDAQCVAAFGHDSSPDVHFCVPYQQGSNQSYSIEVYLGVSLDSINFKPKPPLATPGFGARIPIAFPGSARSEEISCDGLGAGSDPLGSHPWLCWRVPGGQTADSVNSDSPLCGVETPNLNPARQGPFIQLERFVSASHVSRDYLIVLSGYNAPNAGFPEQYCRDFYQVLKSWKWQG
jgi:hypothetical protein